MNNELIQKLILFGKKYGLIIAAALLFLFFLFILAFSAFQSSKPSQTPQININPTTVQTQLNTSGRIPSHAVPSPSEIEPKGEMQEDEREMVVWAPGTVATKDLNSFSPTRTSLPDGTMKYSYITNTPNRPNIIFIKNGINVYQRVAMHNTKFELDPDDIPDYIAQGSKFWGSNMVTYIFLSKGFAYVADTNKKLVLEEIIFQPTDIETFKQFNDDITGQIKKP